jgi:hypothetical protein
MPGFEQVGIVETSVESSLRHSMTSVSSSGDTGKVPACEVSAASIVNAGTSPVRGPAGHLTAVASAIGLGGRA